MNPATQSVTDKASAGHRYPGQIDLPNGGRIWPTLWARHPHDPPDAPREIAHWNAESPAIGFIDQIETRERAELIVTAVNAYSTTQAEIERLREALKAADTFLSHSENQRQLVSGNWKRDSLRYENFCKVKKRVRAALAGEGE